MQKPGTTTAQRRAKVDLKARSEKRQYEGKPKREARSKNCHTGRVPTKNLPGHIEPELGGEGRRSETMKSGVAKERKKNKGRNENNKKNRKRREKGGES